MSYKDVALKTSYYKERIVNELVKSGVFPDKQMIQSRLDNIDKFSAVYGHREAKKGSAFSPEAFNKERQEVWQDLAFLYQLAYEVIHDQLQEVQDFALGHLEEMERMAKEQQSRSRLEIDTTSLGNTILFRSGRSMKQIQKDDAYYFDMGEFEAREGSVVSFAADVSGGTETILIAESEDGFRLRPHHIGNETYTVPGRPETATYGFRMDQDAIVNGWMEVAHSNLTPDRDKDYLVFAGADSVSQHHDRGRSLIKEDEETGSFYFLPTGDVELYIVDGTFAEFSFSRDPLSKNFKGYRVDRFGSYHKIKLRVEEDSSFTVNTDGSVFAEMRRGQVLGDRLIYPAETKARDFIIKEISKGEKRPFRAYLKVTAEKESLPQIAYAAVKEVEALRGDMT